MRSQVGPASKEIKTVAEAEAMLAKDDVVIFGFGAADSTLMKTFSKTADKLRQEYNFAHSSAEAEAMLAKDDVVIFGFGAADSTLMKTFSKTADKLRQEYNFAHPSAEEVMTKLGQKEGVVLYRPKH